MNRTTSIGVRGGLGGDLDPRGLGGRRDSYDELYRYDLVPDIDDFLIDGLGLEGSDLELNGVNSASVETEIA